MGRLTCVALIVSVYCVFSGAFSPELTQNVNQWISHRKKHAGSGLTDEELQKLVAMGDEQHFQQVLQPILVPRVPDTPSHAVVRKHIVDTLRGLQWTVDEAQFQDRTPIANDVTFTNIIATLDPLAPRRLVLACHYDSLKTNSGRFVGATDSAVPCAQLLNLAYVLRDALQAHREQGNEVTLQLLFFDGEEAFVRWSRSDSTYGARQLAAQLQQTPYTDTGAAGISQLHRIDLFVLLDLLGVKNPKFYNYFSASEPWYARLVSFERRLKALGLYQGLRDMFLQEDWFNPGIEDDHIPFLERGVPILHLIPYPFPAAWHKDGDNAASLDAPTIALQNSLFRALVVDYLHLVL
ncbi:glutaminyl-peptide cyclotransferase [Hyalella azteca]|uniref:Glutaminyl-peptide cyclotransferase n=1 Tax=Hyalella azteca TaxID=294128 RepID=A0A8B7PEG2_HYAAZ|nr:glutaminyl-peptide cyclotransferase [Hyalella azteca]